MQNYIHQYLLFLTKSHHVKGLIIIISFNSFVPKRCGSNFKSMIFKLIIQTVLAWALAVKLLSGKYHRTLLMRNQHWFRLWLGAIRQQAITWSNVDPVLCGHKMSPGHNELTAYFVTLPLGSRPGTVSLHNAGDLWNHPTKTAWSHMVPRLGGWHSGNNCYQGWSDRGTNLEYKNNKSDQSF